MNFKKIQRDEPTSESQTKTNDWEVGFFIIFCAANTPE